MFIGRFLDFWRLEYFLFGDFDVPGLGFRHCAVIAPHCVAVVTCGLCVQRMVPRAICIDSDSFHWHSVVLQLDRQSCTGLALELE
jgi:hypothetical protein